MPALVEVFGLPAPEGVAAHTGAGVRKTPKGGNRSGQDVPPRYRVGCVASRRVLPRERFSRVTPLRKWSALRASAVNLRIVP